MGTRCYNTYCADKHLDELDEADLMDRYIKDRAEDLLERFFSEKIYINAENAFNDLPFNQSLHRYIQLDDAKGLGEEILARVRNMCYHAALEAAAEQIKEEANDDDGYRDYRSDD